MHVITFQHFPLWGCPFQDDSLRACLGNGKWGWERECEIGVGRDEGLRFNEWGKKGLDFTHFLFPYPSFPNIQTCPQFLFFWQGKIMPNGTRDSTLELLVGDNGWVTHHENGIYYSLDATKCMFSSGNRSEKLRMGQINCLTRFGVLV